MSEMLVHVLIQTAITFEILKSYRGFCIFLPLKDYTLRLCRLKVEIHWNTLVSEKHRVWWKTMGQVEYTGSGQ